MNLMYSYESVCRSLDRINYVIENKKPLSEKQYKHWWFLALKIEKELIKLENEINDRN